MGFNCGIVGLPNVGKSTLFNALTNTAQAEAANYPFCTINPNIGRVAVPDDRLYKLTKVSKSLKTIPAQLEFVDIAGMVKGASHGEGLGNRFLANIRETDAIIHVVRCFDNKNIVHVHETIDPIYDIEIINTELLLSDLESVEKRLPNLEKKVRNNREKSDLELIAALNKIYDCLKQGKPGICAGISNKNILNQLQLLTTKPVMLVCNVSEKDIQNGNKYTEQVAHYAKDIPVLVVSAAIEAEISVLEHQQEKLDLLNELGITSTGLEKVICQGYSLLNLITYFTSGTAETKAWTVERGTLVPQAAGIIHSDFERGFICAETINWKDFIEYQGEMGAKQAGKLRIEGKEYVVKDGDVMHFRFNV